MSAKVVVEDWRATEILSAIEEAAAGALAEAGALLVSEAAARLDTPYPPASDRGQPPHRRSGRLHDAQAGAEPKIERDGSDVVLSVAVPKSPFYGRIVAKERPWLDEAVLLDADAVVDLVAEAVSRAL